jgi:hypothetical protein
MSFEQRLWINDVKDECGDECGEIAQAVLDKVVLDTEDAEICRNKMIKAHLLEQVFGEDDNGEWTSGYQPIARQR